jgi:hypothetical protein
MLQVSHYLDMRDNDPAVFPLERLTTSIAQFCLLAQELPRIFGSGRCNVWWRMLDTSGAYCNLGHHEDWASLPNVKQLRAPATILETRAPMRPVELAGPDFTTNIVEWAAVTQYAVRELLYPFEFQFGQHAKVARVRPSTEQVQHLLGDLARAFREREQASQKQTTGRE